MPANSEPDYIMKREIAPLTYLYIEPLPDYRATTATSTGSGHAVLWVGNRFCCHKIALRMRWAQVMTALHWINYDPPCCDTQAEAIAWAREFWKTIRRDWVRTAWNELGQ